ncbi:MAG: hypothetical protein QOG64_2592 [Acidimicrobiaceae bacterium]|jgi:hypothetical protein|nr:hypothetical protein [Acidimicrobiaceae bacterium]
MAHERTAQLRLLEGHQVSISLRNGARIDDCKLVSSGGTWVPHLWLYANGGDTFVPLEEIVDLWEVAPHHRAGAA